MEVIYRAFDGETFTTPEECLRHEKESPLFRMFDREGNPVHSPDACQLLQITSPINGAEAFIRLNESIGCDYSGIDYFEAVGLYWWNGEEYCWIEPDMLNALVKSGCIDK